MDSGAGGGASVELEVDDLCRSLAELSPMPMAAVTGPEHVIRYVNPAFCVLNGKANEELTGQPFAAIGPTGGECLAMLRRVHQTEEPATHSGQEDPGAHRLYWSYAMWPIRSKSGMTLGIMIQVTETTPFLLQATSMNNALMLGSVRQHELTAAAEEQNERLEAEITQRKKMERELRASEEHLSALLGEKEVLVHEIHHRVKNNLQVIASLLSLQAGQASNPGVVDALSDAGGRIRVIAELHETLYASPNLAEVNFGEYIRRLTDEVQRLHGRAEISVDIFTDDIVLPMNTAVPLGLIANELILNCFKHAFPSGRGGQVTVSVEYLLRSIDAGESLDDSSICLRVQDNGTGLPPGFQASDTKSLGLRIVHLLGRQLQAEIQATTEAGLTFNVTVPPPISP